MNIFWKNRVSKILGGDTAIGEHTSPPSSLNFLCHSQTWRKSAVRIKTLFCQHFFPHEKKKDRISISQKKGILRSRLKQTATSPSQIKTILKSHLQFDQISHKDCLHSKICDFRRKLRWTVSKHASRMFPIVFLWYFTGFRKKSSWNLLGNKQIDLEDPTSIVFNTDLRNTHNEREV